MNGSVLKNKSLYVVALLLCLSLNSGCGGSSDADDGFITSGSSFYTNGGGSIEGNYLIGEWFLCIEDDLPVFPNNLGKSQTLNLKPDGTFVLTTYSVVKHSDHMQTSESLMNLHMGDWKTDGWSLMLENVDGNIYYVSAYYSDNSIIATFKNSSNGETIKRVFKRTVFIWNE